MTRPLRVVPDGPGVLPALRDALAGGPALFVVAPGRSTEPDAGAHPLPETVPQAVALVVETSGSTGRPKRVALPADAVLASAAAAASALGGPGHWLLALPTHYIAGLNVLARGIASGLDPVPLPESPGPFTPERFLEAAARLEPGVPHHTALVPAQLATLLDDPAASDALAGFTSVLVGGQATPAALAARARATGIRLVRSYGSSETCGGCVYDGVPVGGTRVRLVDGEVRIGGPTLAEGYLGDPEASAERFVDDPEFGGRWFRTADAGEFDGERLTVTGRLDDVIVSGGLKVSLGAVERALREHPGLGDAVVVGAPDARWGERAVAFTASTLDTAAADAALAAVRAALGPAARPELRMLASIPLLPSGKPDRRALAALAAD